MPVRLLLNFRWEAIKTNDGEKRVKKRGEGGGFEKY